MTVVGRCDCVIFIIEVQLESKVAFPFDPFCFFIADFILFYFQQRLLPQTKCQNLLRRCAGIGSLK